MLFTLDANDASEQWSVPRDATVGRVVAIIPAVGAPATLVRTATVPLLIGVVLTIVVVAVLLRGRRPGTHDGHRAAPDEVPVPSQGSDSGT